MVDRGEDGNPDPLRIDKWLWAARFFKTRGLAAEAVDAGHVRINGQRAKRAKPVRIDDRIEVMRGAERIEVRVRALSDRRGPAPVAQALYEETEESRQAREAARTLRQAGSAWAGDAAARPTKRDRRKLDRWRGGVGGPED